MARDRFIQWGSKQPTQVEVENVITNYLGGAASEIKWNKDRFVVRLVGKTSFTFKGLGNHLEASMLERYGPPFDERWFEVYLDETMDVITREADDYTNVVADGLAEIFARYWQGKLESG